MVQRTNRSRKARGGSIASDNVMRLVPTSCPKAQPFFDFQPTITPDPATPNPSEVATPSYIASGGGNSTENVQSLSAQSAALNEREQELNRQIESLNALEKQLNSQLSQINGSSSASQQHGGGDVDYSNATTVDPTAATTADTATLACSGSDTLTSPYNYDSFGRVRGNYGGSYASVPSNAFQKVNNWFQGETTLLTPNENSYMNQNAANYFSKGPDIGALGGTIPDLSSAQFDTSHVQDGSSQPVFADRQAIPNKFNIQFSRSGAGGSRRRRNSRRQSARRH